MAQVKTARFVATSVFLCGVLLLLWTFSASADGPIPDTDQDGLPDSMEEVLDPTMRTQADTDGDGASDLKEWLGRTHPLDPYSFPVGLQPSVRGFAWQEAAGAPVQLHVDVYPAASLQSLRVFFLSGKAPNQVIQEITPVIGSVQPGPDGAAGLTFTLSTTSPDTLSNFAPLCIGLVAGTEAAGNVVVDRLALLDKPGSTGLMLLERLTGDHLDSALAALDPNVRGEGEVDEDEDARYCKLTLDAGDPTGLGGIKYTVQSGECIPDALLYCVDADCKGQVGKEIVLIDYGFLQTKAKKK